MKFILDLQSRKVNLILYVSGDCLGNWISFDKQKNPTFCKEICKPIIFQHLSKKERLAITCLCVVIVLWALSASLFSCHIKHPCLLLLQFSQIHLRKEKEGETEGVSEREKEGELVWVRRREFWPLMIEWVPCHTLNLTPINYSFFMLCTIFSLFIMSLPALILIHDLSACWTFWNYTLMRILLCFFFGRAREGRGTRDES